MPHTLRASLDEDLALLKLDMKKVDVATVEKAVENSTLWRLHMRVHGAATAAAANRLDLVAYFIEQLKVPVNTVPEEERCIYPDFTGYMNRKDLVAATPLHSALIRGSREMINYLLDRVDKREGDTRVFNEGTCLMVAAERGETSGCHAVGP